MNPRQQNIIDTFSVDELEKAINGKTKKSVIRDNDIQSGSPDDYSSMSNGEKIAHHYYAAQHHDNERKKSSKKIAQYATAHSEGKLSKEDYDKLTREHNQGMTKSHKKFQQHIETVHKLGGIESLDDVEKTKAGNWINNNFSDEAEKGFEINPDKVSEYYQKYGDIHDQKFPKSAEDLYNKILQNAEGEYDLADIHAVYSQLDKNDLKLGTYKNPQQYHALVLDKIETLKSKIKTDLEDDKLNDILTAIIKTTNKKESK